MARAREPYDVQEDPDVIRISTEAIEATVRKHDYVTGVAGGSFLDRKTGARDLGHGLDITDWIMEPGSDEAYRAQLPKVLVYEFNNPWHGRIAKRIVEGPQICTQVKRLDPHVIRGADFVAVRQSYRYQLAAPGRKPGSEWTQTIVFPAGKRYFVSCQSIRMANTVEAPFVRIDMPGHIKHKDGDTFSEVYLSYHGVIPASEFRADFPPDARFRYARGLTPVPGRFIRAYHIRGGPWLAGMTLDPDVVSDAWCHQRGYVCLIEEFGGRPVREGDTFRAAFVVGFFDSIDEMNAVYDAYRGHTGLEASATGWRLV
jgi:hypothetical protein